MKQSRSQRIGSLFYLLVHETVIFRSCYSSYWLPVYIVGWFVLDRCFLATDLPIINNKYNIINFIQRETQSATV